MTESKIHPGAPAVQAEPGQMTAEGVAALVKHNAQKQVENALVSLVEQARLEWFDHPDQLRGFVLGFLLNYPEIHNAQVPKDAQ